MAPAPPYKLAAATLLAAALATPAAAFDLFGPSCLEKLTARTRTWTECTQQFDRNDARCKRPAGKMQAAMQECAREGKDKAQIDAAMRKAYSEAGRRRPNATTGDNAPAATPRPGSIESATLDKITPAPKQAASPPPSN